MRFLSVLFHRGRTHGRLPVAAPITASIFLLGFSGMLVGCGPIISTSIILEAQANLDAANAVEAAEYAPYEHTAAVAYLHKAKEEQGYADFGPSIDMASKARDMALKALSVAQEKRRAAVKSKTSGKSLDQSPNQPSEKKSEKSTGEQP